jgi:dipeptidyl aminopeptidase/acylaminoacyl peptidase
LFVATDVGRSNIYRVELATEELSRLTTRPSTVTSLDVQSRTFVLTGQDWDHPGDLFAGTIAENGELAEYRRVTEVNHTLLKGRKMARPERFEFETFDGQSVEAWIIKPLDFRADKLYPVVLEIHGGPAGTYGDTYMHEFQVLASRGYGVLFTNPRGSKGYGEQWAQGVIGDWGGGDYADLMACVDSAVKQFSWIDPDRLGVTGGSYGGYMTNWIVSQTHQFRAAVTQRSISNLYTKYGVSDIGFYANRAGMGGADLWEEEDFIMSRSPIRYAPNVRTPILIIHSEEDLRCPMEQAEQWYIALRRLGNTDVEFVRFAGENHELSRAGKPLNRVERLEQLVGWFERYIPPTDS